MDVVRIVRVIIHILIDLPRWCSVWVIYFIEPWIFHPHHAGMMDSSCENQGSERQTKHVWNRLGTFFQSILYCLPHIHGKQWNMGAQMFCFLDMSFVCLILYGIYLNQSHLFEDRSWSVHMVDTEPDIGEHKYEQEAASALFIHSRQRYVLAWQRGATIPVEGNFQTLCASRNDCFQTDLYILYKVLRENAY